MDALSALLPFLDSPEFLQTLISIALAAVVFFYFVRLLRKDETIAQADDDQVAANLGARMRRQA